MQGVGDIFVSAAVVSELVLGGLLLCTVLAIVLHRLARLWLDTDVARRRSRYDESAALLVAGEMDSLTLTRLVAPRDHKLVEDLLAEYAEKFSGEVHQSLAEAFVGIGAVARNRARARSRFWWVRAGAAHRLGLMGYPPVTRALRPLLADRHLEVRLAAARSLVELGADKMIGDLAGSLAEPDLFSGLRLADVILDAGHGAVPSLIRFVCTSPVARGVALALDILGDMRAVEATEVIGNALQHSPSLEVRAAACRALGRMESPEAVPLLCRALHDATWEVRGQAVQALGRMADPAALPMILPFLEEASPWVVYNAAVALGSMGPEGMDALRRAHGRPGTPLRALILEEVLATQPQEV
jgi:hypothetical protein